jgi:hypothetical protein
MDAETIRSMDVASDPELGTEEKELRMTACKDEDRLTISTEIPTIIKWLQSIEPVEWKSTRVIDDALVAVTATVPKGIVKLQATARWTNTHSGMVSYGDCRGVSD